MKIDDQGQIVYFCEKPQSDTELDELRLDEAPGEPPNELYMASMGIYIFEPQLLVSLLMGSDQDDFGKHIIPDAIHKVGVYAHTFEGYWEDIGTIRSFYEANLALTDSARPLISTTPERPFIRIRDFLPARAWKIAASNEGSSAKGPIFATPRLSVR